MKTISSVLLFSLIFYCCTSTHTLLRNQSDYSQLNIKARENDAKITMMDDNVINVRNITIRIDSTYLIDLDSTYWSDSEYWSEKYVKRSLPTAEVKAISIKTTQPKWVLAGCAVVGTFVGHAVSPKGKLRPGWRPGYADYTGLKWAGTIIGAIIGLGIGAFIVPKPTDNYILSTSADSTSTSNEDEH